MIVISDTSPLSGLFRIGYLHLFEPLYGKIIIPPAVKDELLELVHFGSDPSQILSQPWLEIRAFQNAALYQKFRRELDEGEAQAIAIALESGADLLLIDEAMGRKIALREGLKITGILGMLLDAKNMGLIVAVKPLMTISSPKRG